MICLDSIYYVDTVMKPCIDCLLRIKAVRADKDSCIADNTKLLIQNQELWAINEEYDRKVITIGKLNLGFGEGLGVGIGLTGLVTYLITR